MDARKATSKQIHALSAKMTPEMCRAIKRQEKNSGLDYWKTGFSNLSAADGNSSLQDKKPTYRRLTQINFDFPGLFLPNVGTQSLRQKRKDTKGQPIVLSRAKTSLAPEIKTGSSDVRIRSESQNPSKKVAMTDLTCLQLADTLLSYNKSPLTGVYGTSTFGLYSSPLKSRYVDLFCDNKTGQNNDCGDEQSKPNERADNHESTEERKIPILMYHTFQPDDNANIAERQRVIVSPSSDTPEFSDNDVHAKPQTKPQKSILKNGVKRTNRPSSETAISYTYSTLEKPTASSYQLPGTKSQLRAVSETKLPTSSLYPRPIQNDLRDFGHFRGLRNIPVQHENTGAVRNIPVRLEREQTSFGEYRGLETRKRSVRFNAAHEVREYIPCEPISFC